MSKDSMYDLGQKNREAVLGALSAAKHKDKEARRLESWREPGERTITELAAAKAMKLKRNALLGHLRALEKARKLSTREHPKDARRGLLYRAT